MVQHRPATPASSASVVTDWSDNDAMGLLEGLLVQRPILCLSDEPGIGLAAKVAEEVFSHICTLAATATSILLIDHNTRKVIDTRSEEHTSELQSLMRISYAVFCLKKKQKQ